MRFIDRLFGWKEYYDRKFDEFLKTIKEGFKLRDDRLSRLEFQIQRPTIQPVVQEVKIDKKQLLRLMDDEEIKRQISEHIDPSKFKTELKQELILDEGLREHILQIVKNIVKEEVTVTNDTNDTPVTVTNRYPQLPQAAKPLVTNDSNRNYSMKKALEYLPQSRVYLVNFLMQADRPMSYKQIAQKTGLAYNTIKVYLKDIRDAGCPIEEEYKRNLLLIAIPNQIKNWTDPLLVYH